MGICIIHLSRRTSYLLQMIKNCWNYLLTVLSIRIMIIRLNFFKSFVILRNGQPMFERLAVVVEDYNKSCQGRAVLQEYDVSTEKALILCVVTNLMARVHEK